MPAHADTTSSLERQLLLQLGERLKRGRVSQGLSAAVLAQQVGISRTTLHDVEAGEPSPSMGIYLRVMSALGMAGDLALLATDAVREWPGKPGRPPVAEGQAADDSQQQAVVVKVDSDRHIAQDLQSLMLHKEAVKLILKDPALAKQAQDTLSRWRAKGDSHAAPLWDEWAVILHRRDWHKVLGNTRRARELRQASPLSTLVPQATRLRIIAEVRALKRGVDVSRGPKSADSLR